MRIIGTLSIVTLFLFLVASAPGYSQDRDEAKPGQPQEEKDKAKHEDKAKHDDKAKQDEGKRDEAPPSARPQEPQQQREERPERRMERDQHERPAQAQRGRHIPDDKFRTQFGRQHAFHVQRTQIINNPQPVIVYGGYSFQLVEPWPVDWSFDDDCYIDYVDQQYFLFDAFHPGIRVVVFVVG